MPNHGRSFESAHSLRLPAAALRHVNVVAGWISCFTLLYVTLLCFIHLLPVIAHIVLLFTPGEKGVTKG
jgi:hypothetical protein